MQPQAMRDIVRRFIDEPWNKGNVDVIDELCAPDYTIAPASAPVHGREALKRSVVGWRTAMPDFAATVTDIIVEGDSVAFSWIMQGTQEGRRRILDGITILRFSDGKIVEDRFVSCERSGEDTLSLEENKPSIHMES